jgi:uncharacterized membrane protein (DUF485 family)
MAKAAYFKKIQTINNQRFRTTKTTVVTLAFFVVTIAIVFAVYFIYIILFAFEELKLSTE